MQQGFSNIRPAAGIALFALTLSVGVTPVSAEPVGGTGCSPEPAVARIVDSVGRSSEILELSHEAWDEALARVDRALDEHPGDLFLHRTRQNLYRYAPKSVSAEALPRVRREYAELRDAHPGEPRFAYLLGRITDEREVEREAFSAALEMDPDFPWGHLGMVAVALKDGDGQEGAAGPDDARAREHLARFQELCPDRLYPGLFYSRSVGGSEFWESRLPEIRERLHEHLAEEGSGEPVRALPLLWGLEFRLAEPAEHEAVRERIAEDLAVLEATDSERTPVLEVLKEGYTLAGDTEAAAEIDERLRTGSPCSREAVHAAIDEWSERSAEAGESMSKEELRAERRAFAETTREWVERCPDQYLYWLVHLEALDALDDVDPAELVAAGERVAELYGQYRGFSNPTGFGRVAQVFVERGLELERVPGLLDRADAERKERTEGWNLEDLPEEQRRKIERSLEYGALHRALLRARARAALDEVEAARSLLGEIRARLDALKPEDVPDGGAASREQLAHRGYESALWQLRAELAEAEGRTADALAYWLRAESVRPVDAPSWVRGPSREEARERAVELWAGLGGTEDGLAAMDGVVVASAETGAALAEYSPWEEAEGGLPSFELSDPTGVVWKSENLEGKALFINAWATWCGPCRQELPVIQELHERFRDREDVVVITLNMDDNPGVVAPYLDEEGFTFPVLLATDYLREELGVSAIPRSWILDPELSRRFVQEGFDPSVDEEDWLAEVEGLIRESSGSGG